MSWGLLGERELLARRFRDCVTRPSRAMSARRRRIDPMALKADEVYEAGLQLDLDERTLVAHRLLASLHSAEPADQPEVDAAWRDEIASRVDDILNDKVELGSFEETRAKARALLDELRK